jgi:hypothetical protein
MQKRFTVGALTMLSITCGAALAAQLTPAQRIDRVTTLLKSLETRDLRPPTSVPATRSTICRSRMAPPASGNWCFIHRQVQLFIR